MSRKAHGQLRRSQIITTWGPGSLLDLPNDSVIVGGLDIWPRISDLEEITEQRLSSKLQLMTGVPAPRLYAPPADNNDPRETKKGIGVWRFPEWYVVQEENKSSDGNERSRRLVNRKALDGRKFEGLKAVPTRFVRACPRGHVDDIDWRLFVHGPGNPCTRRELWLDERGTSGDLGDLSVRCACKRSRALYEAMEFENHPLGICRGKRPWLGHGSREDCHLPSRLLIRTAANAYFPQVVSVLSLPDRGTQVQQSVKSLWDHLQIVDNLADLTVMKRLPHIAEELEPFSDDEVLDAIRSIRKGGDDDRPVKHVELDALLAVPEGYGDDVPIDNNFHARRLPESSWRRFDQSNPIECVIQVHRLKEVLALAGFTRFEAVTPDINGEYETDVERAKLAIEPRWFPATENRGEGVFIQLRAESVADWLGRDGVKNRVDQLRAGHRCWVKNRQRQHAFPGGPYVLLHTLSHLLIQSLSMRCGYPASSVRERIYVDVAGNRYGILLYTASPDAEGTLGGLVQEGRHIELHLSNALRTGALCSNDPICAQHAPGESMEGRWLQGAACHGCALVAETSCEMWNDYLDRALVVPVLGEPDAAFFGVAE